MGRKRTNEDDIARRFELYSDTNFIIGQLSIFKKDDFKVAKVGAEATYYMNEAISNLLGLFELLKDSLYYADKNRRSPLKPASTIPQYGTRFLGYAITSTSKGKAEWVICERIMPSSQTVTIVHNEGDQEIVELIGWLPLPRRKNVRRSAVKNA